jgi:epoxyqueuosine reductase
MTKDMKLANALKAEAKRLGFSACGISEAALLDESARRLEAWLHAGRHASMQWMENHFDKRIDPRNLVEGAKSVISVVHTYFQPADFSLDAAKISRYAWGEDYHEVLKSKLFALYAWLEAEVGGIQGRAFVDSAPVMDKVWAERSGLGWIGKNTNLINQKLGSFFFVGELIVDVPLPPDHATEDHCGSCTRCIDACPTDAIYPEGFVDANKCISYWTIEHRGNDVPTDLTQQFGAWIFGCDICQEVCPWNKFKQTTPEPRFQMREGMNNTTLQEWLELDLEAFRKRFKGNPVKRTKYEGFRRNVLNMQMAQQAKSGQDDLEKR